MLSPRHGSYSLEKAQTKALPLNCVIEERKNVGGLKPAPHVIRLNCFCLRQRHYGNQFGLTGLAAFVMPTFETTAQISFVSEFKVVSLLNGS